MRVCDRSGSIGCQIAATRTRPHPALANLSSRTSNPVHMSMNKFVHLSVCLTIHLLLSTNMSFMSMHTSAHMPICMCTCVQDIRLASASVPSGKHAHRSPGSWIRGLLQSGCRPLTVLPVFPSAVRKEEQLPCVGKYSRECKGLDHRIKPTWFVRSQLLTRWCCPSTRPSSTKLVLLYLPHFPGSH